MNLCIISAVQYHMGGKAIPPRLLVAIILLACSVFVPSTRGARNSPLLPSQSYRTDVNHALEQLPSDEVDCIAAHRRELLNEVRLLALPELGQPRKAQSSTKLQTSTLTGMAKHHHHCSAFQCIASTERVRSREHLPLMHSTRRQPLGHVHGPSHSYKIVFSLM